jgi:large subunit ribosomal protein L6
MSRIGNKIINIPAGVQVSLDGATLKVKGKTAELIQTLDSCIQAEIDGSTVSLKRQSDDKPHKAKHGLYRALVNNMIIGVSTGFKKDMELVGVGYRAVLKGQFLELSLGFSHQVIMEIPKEVSIAVVTEKGKNTVINLSSFDKQLLGFVAAKIRSFREPEPYKGKGIRFVGEDIRRKSGKSTGKGKK